jgi:flagellar motility protein MotE (MotC chaperone)
MIGGLRLVDGVVIAAIALLALKALGFLSNPRRVDAGAEAASVAAQHRELPKFARVLAHARSNDASSDVVVTGAVAEEKGTEPPTAEAAPPEGTRPSASTSERALLERLGERRDELQHRASEIDMRERLLEDAERKLESRINELKAMEEKAEAAATKRGDTEAGALRNLVTMYESMKPKDAAKIFDRLSHDVLVPVVLQMKPPKMAEVLAVMMPETAEKLTVALAMRAKGLSGETRNAAPSALPATELPAIEPPPTQPKR